MKILNLEIISPEKQIVRNINFSYSELSIILANTEKEDSRETINSLGKTLLLKMIDYMLGANNDKSFFKKEIHGFIIRGVVEHYNKQHICVRTIGDVNNNKIDDEHYSLSEYKKFFSIERSMFDKQILLEEKKSLISSRQNPTEIDYRVILKLLGFEKLSEIISEIYNIQDSIKDLKKNKKIFMSSIGINNDKEVQEYIFLIEKDVENYEEKIKKTANEIKKLELTNLKDNAYERYATLNAEYKDIKNQINIYDFEIKRLSRFIKDSESSDIKSKDLKLIFDRANIDLPGYVERTLDEAEQFHKKVYLDRKEYLSKEIEDLTSKKNDLSKYSSNISEEIDELGNIIAENKAYKEAINYYSEFNKKLNELKYKQGQLTELKHTIKKISKYESLLTEKFEAANVAITDDKEEIEKYTEFIYNLVTKIYTDKVKAFFNISIRERHLTWRPIVFELNLRGDTGEGVGNVRKLLIDYMIFYYNKDLELLLQDSSCYNGIDPRQVNSMIRELNNLAVKSGKQAIISLNKYQVTDKDQDEIFIEDKSVITLSENDNLLGFSF